MRKILLTFLLVLCVLQVSALEIYNEPIDGGGSYYISVTTDAANVYKKNTNTFYFAGSESIPLKFYKNEKNDDHVQWRINSSIGATGYTIMAGDNGDGTQEITASSNSEMKLAVYKRTEYEHRHCTISAVWPFSGCILYGSYHWHWNGWVKQNSFDYSAAFYLDDAPPALTVTSEPSGWTNGSAILAASATDSGSGLKSIQYRIGSGSWQAYAGTVTRTNTTAISFRAVDNVNNISSEKVITPKIDKTAPVFSKDFTIDPASWTNGTVAVTANASDVGGSGIDSGDGWKPLYFMPNSPCYKTVIVSENQKVDFTVSDRAGNSSERSYLVSNIDRSPPSIAILKFPDVVWSNIDVKLTASADDGGQSPIDQSTWDYSAMGAEVFSGAGNSLILTREGITTVNFSVDDTAGNTGTQLATVAIDKTLPFVSVVLPSNDWIGHNYLNTNNITLAGLAIDITASDGLSGISSIQYKKKSDENWLSVTGSTGSVSGLQEGITTYQFRAIDKAGNVSSVVEKTVRIDLTAPSLSIVNSHESSWSNTQVTLTVSATDIGVGVDDASYQYRIGPSGAW